MKKLITLAAAMLIALAGTVNAQNGKQASASCDMKNCYMKKGGFMVMIKEGVETPMDAPMTLANGFTVYPDGVAANQSSGQRVMLMDNDCVDIAGNFHFAQPNPTAPDAAKQSTGNPADKK